jgi:hypothetical protein
MNVRMAVILSIIRCLSLGLAFCLCGGLSGCLIDYAGALFLLLLRKGSTQKQNSKPQKSAKQSHRPQARKKYRAAGGNPLNHFRKESRSITNRYLTSLFNIRS